MNDDDDQRLDVLEVGLIAMKETVNSLCSELERIIRLVEGNSSRAA